jgi:transposase-like protein
MEENIVGRKPLSGVESLEWVSRFHASGLSVQRFARQNGITPGQLHYWLYVKHPHTKRKPKPPLFTSVNKGEWAFDG